MWSYSLNDRLGVKLMASCEVGLGPSILKKVGLLPTKQPSAISRGLFSLQVSAEIDL
jgi:hypothetical protein